MLHILVNSPYLGLIFPIYRNPSGRDSSVKESSKEWQTKQVRSVLFAALVPSDNKIASHPHCYLELPVKHPPTVPSLIMKRVEFWTIPRRKF